MALAKKFTLLTLALTLVLAAGAQAAMEKAELINGTHWTKWSQEAKLVYIRGVGNWADFIAAAQPAKARNWEGCISKAFVNELQNKTLGQIMAEVDGFYKKNPGKLDTSVIEVVLRRSTSICPPGPQAMERTK